VSGNVDVSIIIVNWNTQLLLKNCIDSIIDQTRKISYEIIVVDNNSSDGSPEMLKREYKDSVILIHNSQNRGFAAANNQAMKIAKGNFLLLLNSDTKVLDNAIEKSHAYISAHSDVGLIGCKLLNGDNTLQYSCYNFNSIISAFMFKTKLIRKVKLSKRYKYEGLITSNDYNSDMDVDYVCGAYMMFRRDILSKVGYLDESFFMYAEEADYCARIKKSGYRIVYFAGGKIIHFGGGSSKKISLISENRRIISRLLFIKKHKGVLYFSIYRFFSILTVLGNMAFASGQKKRDSKSKLSAILKLKYE
jgi:GT2 family glycosyltransferase